MPSGAPFELVLPDGMRVPLVEEVTLGRDPDSTVVLTDPAVSRLHARIRVRDGEGASVEDVGSSHGTYVDGVRVRERTALHDGARLRLGDSELAVERIRDASEAARTIVVPAGERPGTNGRLRVRSGYALKRLEAAEGDRRWILKDLESGKYLHLTDADAQLFELLDGTRSLSELIAGAEQRLGPDGATRLARLLADLGERGFIEGVGGPPAAAVREPWYRRAFNPRERLVPGAGDLFDAVYRAGGRLLFTRPALFVLATLAAIGVIVFAYLVAARYGTPFVVASKLGIGGLVFLLGRTAVVAVHELAHGLAMASYGRRVERAGFKLLLVFPYAFVDTSAAWFEPRRHRIVVSAAGPASDFVLGALFSLACLVLAPGAVRDVCFQVAFAAYVGACFNLNPFLDRDGYHILVDVLREPGLRRRAREQLARRGGPRSPVLARYSLLGLAWSCLAVLFVVAMTLRVRPALDAVVPAWLVWVAIVPVWLVACVPVVLAIAGRRG
jgi:pSer/pThr/pTyr-binding forkhead associated (FHA) protein